MVLNSQNMSLKRFIDDEFTKFFSLIHEQYILNLCSSKRKLHKDIEVDIHSKKKIIADTRTDESYAYRRFPLFHREVNILSYIQTRRTDG